MDMFFDDDDDDEYGDMDGSMKVLIMVKISFFNKFEGMIKFRKLWKLNKRFLEDLMDVEGELFDLFDMCKM